MIAIIVFTLIIIGEILVCVFRGTKWSLIRAASSALCLLAAFAVAYMIARNIDFKILAGSIKDHTFGGNISETIGAKLIETADKILSGVISCLIQVILFWILKGASYFITRAVIKKRSSGNDSTAGKVRFNPIGIAIGLICGIVFGGFSVMPYTGLMQGFKSSETVTEIADILKAYDQDKYADIVSKAISPSSRYVVKYTGIGFVTDANFNLLTTVKTDSGNVGLTQLIEVITKNLGIVTATWDSTSISSDITGKIVDMSDDFDDLDILTDSEKLSLISDILKKTLPDFDLPDYDSMKELTEDIRLVNESIKILEDSGIDLSSANISASDVKLSKEKVDTLADNLYSLNQGEYYVDYALEKILGTKEASIDKTVDFTETKSDLVNVANAVLNINEKAQGSLKSDETTKYVNEQLTVIKENNILNEAGYNALLNLLENNYKIDTSAIK